MASPRAVGPAGCVNKEMPCPAPKGWVMSTFTKCFAGGDADPLHAGHPAGHGGFSILRSDTKSISANSPNVHSEIK